MDKNKYEFSVVDVRINPLVTIQVLDEYGKYGWQIAAANDNYVFMQRIAPKGDKGGEK